MPLDPVGAAADALFESFVRELARSPQLSYILSRLRDGHHVDPHGWCCHPSHAHRWQQYPCSTMRLVELVEAVDRQGRRPEPGSRNGHQPAFGRQRRPTTRASPVPHPVDHQER